MPQLSFPARPKYKPPQGMNDAEKNNNNYYENSDNNNNNHNNKNYSNHNNNNPLNHTSTPVERKKALTLGRRDEKIQAAKL